MWLDRSRHGSGAGGRDGGYGGRSGHILLNVVMLRWTSGSARRHADRRHHCTGLALRLDHDLVAVLRWTTSDARHHANRRCNCIKLALRLGNDLRRAIQTLDGGCRGGLGEVNQGVESRANGKTHVGASH